MEQLGFYWQIFMIFDISVLFQKYVKKIQAPLKSDENNRYIM
jgi:hypothetical protein